MRGSCEDHGEAGSGEESQGEYRARAGGVECELEGQAQGPDTSHRFRKKSAPWPQGERQNRKDETSRQDQSPCLESPDDAEEQDEQTQLNGQP